MDLVYSKREKIVGMFMLSVFLLLFASLVLIGRGKNWFQSYLTYYAVFKESYNLQENAAVKLHKASIGNVSKIELTDDGVEVKLDILEDYKQKITRETTVTVKSPTFIGDEYVAVIPGDKQAPLLEEGERIKSIPKRSLEDILNEFQVEKTARKLTIAVQNVSEITDALRDPEGPLFTAFEEIQTILVNLSEATAKTPMIMDHLDDNLLTIDKISNEVYYNMSHIKDLLKGVEETLQRLKASLANVEDASYDIPRITQSTQTGIEEIRNAVEETDRVIRSLQDNFFIKKNLPPTPEGENLDAGLRE
ncbi:MAG: MlaD family protein [Thermodesulfobacteriota bacterium]|nr:MlaD family protein [Thermodesulfobacteriota bacterium]